MRILIHGINYHPEQIGIGKYTGEMAIWLAKRGHDVHVVTALPYYPSWQVAKEYAAWQYRREIRSGVSVFRCPFVGPIKSNCAQTTDSSGKLCHKQPSRYGKTYHLEAGYCTGYRTSFYFALPRRG